VGNAASRLGVSLQKVRHVLFTHGHPDHLAPDFLLWRSWIRTLDTLHIWGPRHAITRFEHWVTDKAPVVFHVIEPGDHFVAATSRGKVGVRVLPASHAHGNGDVFADEAVLYDITATDGDRLLYASDTGPLSDSCLDSVRERNFDLVLIEETFGQHVLHKTGHLDLSTLPATLADLRRVGAITAASDVVAIHLSHHNPPADQLSLALAPHQARIVDDGTVIDTRTTQKSRTLIVGGARSGKSAFAESLASHSREVTYVATGGERPGDSEWLERVQAHQSRRPQHWRTLESSDLIGIITNCTSGLLLIDCVSLWLTHVLDAADAWNEDEGLRSLATTQAHHAIDELAAAVRTAGVELIIVSNEVGQGVVPETASGRLFRDLLGIANTKLADACSQAYFMVAGQVLPLAAVSHLIAKEHQ